MARAVFFHQEVFQQAVAFSCLFVEVGSPLRPLPVTQQLFWSRLDRGFFFSQFLRHAPLKDEWFSFFRSHFVCLWREKGLHCPRDPHVAQACGCERMRVPFLIPLRRSFHRLFRSSLGFPSFLKKRHQTRRWFEAFWIDRRHGPPAVERESTER